MLGRERSLSAEVSHQLRTPLSGLRLELEALRSRQVDVGPALAAVDRLDGIIADVIALARDLPTLQSAVVAELLSSAEHRWHGPLAAATRPLRLVVDPDLPAAIAISSRAAAQILDVFVDNARLHGRGAITIHARAMDGAVAIDVSDEGTGVAAAGTHDV